MSFLNTMKSRGAIEESKLAQVDNIIECYTADMWGCYTLIAESTMEYEQEITAKLRESDYLELESMFTKEDRSQLLEGMGAKIVTAIVEWWKNFSAKVAGLFKQVMDTISAKLTPDGKKFIDKYHAKIIDNVNLHGKDFEYDYQEIGDVGSLIATACDAPNKIMHKSKYSLEEITNLNNKQVEYGSMTLKDHQDAVILELANSVGVGHVGAVHMLDSSVQSYLYKGVNHKKGINEAEAKSMMETVAGGKAEYETLRKSLKEYQKGVNEILSVLNRWGKNVGKEDVNIVGKSLHHDKSVSVGGKTVDLSQHGGIRYTSLDKFQDKDGNTVGLGDLEGKTYIDFGDERRAMVQLSSSMNKRAYELALRVMMSGANAIKYKYTQDRRILEAIVRAN